MRRLFSLVLILTGCLGLCLAAEGEVATVTSKTIQYEGPNQRVDESLSVGLQLAPEHSFHYTVGITSSNSNNTPTRSLSLTPVISGDTASFEEMTAAYIYWDIFGTDSFDLFLTLSGPLMCDSTDDSIDNDIGWSVGFNEEGAGTVEWVDEINHSDTTRITVLQYRYPGTGIPDASGRRQLRISPVVDVPDDGKPHIAADYHGYIILQMESVT